MIDNLSDALFYHFMVDNLADDFTNYVTKSYVGYPYLIMDFLEETATFDEDFVRQQGYSPISQDIASLICDLFFARVNASLTMREGRGRDEFMAWTLDTIADIIDMFSEKYDKIYDFYFADKMSVIPNFKSNYLKYVISAAAECLAVEMRGRLLSMDDTARSVRDIADEEKKNTAFDEVMAVAGVFASKKGQFICGADFAAAIEDKI